MQINLKKENLTIIAGHDKKMDYSFMSILNESGDIEYSNMHEEDPFAIKDFTFFEKTAKEQFDLDLSAITRAVQFFKDIMADSSSFRPMPSTREFKQSLSMIEGCEEVAKSVVDQ